LPVRVARPFEGLTFDRPVYLTHAGDGSGRLFVVGQRGTIHMLDNTTSPTPQVFLNIREQVRYYDNQNEEGLLGLAFHPNYEENGQFFIYYTSREIQPDGEHLSVISRLRVSQDDPNKADPASEEVLMTIEQPYWNHNGGTIVFGPDGFLYIGLGDGGAANDPHGHGQDLETLLGSILRIDVNTKSDGLAYGIPADNPFVGRPDARPEIYAYGIRNVWRIAFDAETGHLWAGDVGQDLWEEIDIIQKGGNYGWNLREGQHPFGKNGAEASPELIDPIFEYHHDIGKSITGGSVYRGQRVPQLVGKYVYADYVSGDIWALDYDEESQMVRGNYSVPWEKLPVMTFGEDEAGELYFTTTFGHLYRFEPAE
jgi:quinoprotein glucose dehydrogenase